MDVKVAETLAELDTMVPLQYVKPGVYTLSGKTVNVRVLNGYLVIRVGGGYMRFHEWYCVSPFIIIYVLLMYVYYLSQGGPVWQEIRHPDIKL